LSFSSDSHRITRSVRITAKAPDRQTFNILVGADLPSQRFTIGPLRLEGGRTKATLSATPGPARAGRRDTRQISIRILGLKASTIAPESASVP
jgi:hypothetical protein